ncbi:MAG: hypothetical protein FWG48_05205, partial [Oscillospiraceae bacterium]|nr:hypothetical protein [Oscillospiraceae bacterium]
MRGKLYKLISVALVLVMVLGFIPNLDFLGSKALAATNAGNAFQGQDSDIFTALGFDTSVIPDGYDGDDTGNPYGREKMAGNVVYELLLARQSGYNIFGNNNNNVKYSDVSMNGVNATSMPINAVLSAGAVGDFDGDGLVGEVAYVGFETIDTKDGNRQQLNLYVFDAKTGRYSDAKFLGETTPNWAGGGAEQYQKESRWQNMLQIACGDFDGDGTSEIAVYVGEQDNPRVDIYKYQRTGNSGASDWLDMGNWSRVWSYALSRSGDNIPNMVSLCAGDINRNGIDDLAISYGRALYRTDRRDVKFPLILATMTYAAPQSVLVDYTASKAAVLWGASGGMLQKQTQVDLEAGDVGQQIRASFTMGDITGDNNKELVMTGQPVSDASGNSKRTVVTYMYDETAGLVVDVAETLKVVDGSFITIEIGDETTTQFTSNNGFDEHYYSLPFMRTNSAVVKPAGCDYTLIYVDSVLAKYVEGSISLEYELDDKKYDGETEVPADNKWGWWSTDTRAHSDGFSEYNAVSGDINGNGYDILNVSFIQEVYQPYETPVLPPIGSAPLAPPPFSTFSYSTLGGTGGGKLNWTKFDVAHTRDPKSQPAITMPDMDKDSVIIEYTGNHYLTYSDPQVLAII